MTARDWVIKKLSDDREWRSDRVPVGITPAADYGFVVERRDLPDAHVYCPEVGDAIVTTADVDRAVAAFPAVEFILVLRRGAANDVYPYAEERGIAVGRMGELHSALAGSHDISQFVSRERTYVAGRLNTHRAVQSWQRVGENAYRIRRSGLTPPTLTIATFDTYETTADEIRSLIEKYSDLDLDAIVATNPSTKGFAGPPYQAARDAHVQLMMMNEFAADLGRSWDQ